MKSLKLRTPPTRSHLLLCLLALVVGVAHADEPLPDPGPFLEQFKETILSDEGLLSSYTYDEERTLHKLDKKGEIKKTTTEVHEVFPSIHPELFYYRLVARDGEPLSEKKLAKQDAEHAKEARKFLESLDQDNEKKNRRREEQERKQEEEEREYADEMFQMFTFEMVGRESIDGNAAIVFKLDPQSGYVPKQKAARKLQNMRGTMWVSEKDHQMVRLEMELTDKVKFGGGLVASVKKGARMEMQRTQINDEIWLTSESYARASARLFLVKGLRFEERRQYSNYRKFGAESSWSPDGIVEAGER
jgi:hypothetical protein